MFQVQIFNSISIAQFFVPGKEDSELEFHIQINNI